MTTGDSLSTTTIKMKYQITQQKRGKRIECDSPAPSARGTLPRTTFRFSHHRFSKLGLLVPLLVGIFFLVSPHEVHAGFIVQRPLYIGLTSGLVGQWTFDGPDMAGVIAYDKSGQSNNGTLTGGPVTTLGKIGQGLQFDSVDDVISVAAASSLNNISTLSISVWEKPNGYGAGGQGHIVNKNGDFTGAGWVFGNYVTGSAGLRFQVMHDGGTHLTVNANNTLPSSEFGKWVHWVVTWDGTSAASSVRMYKNGVEIATSGTSGVGSRPSDSSNILTIGNKPTPNRGVDGILDEVRIYNRALSAEEIKRLYNIGGTTKVNKTRTDTLTDGLVGHWTFDGPDMAGVIAYDKSGQGNKGTLTNGPTTALGKIGQGMSFDGVNDVVSIAGPTVSATAMSVSMWVNLRNYDNTYPAWFSASGASNGLNLGVASVAQMFYSSGLYFSANYITLGIWQHLTYTISGGSISLYVNGIFKESQSFSPTGSYTSYNIGYFGSSNLYMNGSIDDVRIYNRALSPAEIKRLYNIGGTTKVNKTRTDTLTDGLVGHWTFDGPDMAGVIAYDKSGQGNNGTLTNGPVTTLGKIGQGMSFDGVNDYVTIPSSSIFDFANDYTFSLWFWDDPNSSTGSFVAMAGRMDAGGGNDYWQFQRVTTTRVDAVISVSTVGVRLNGGAHVRGRWELFTLTRTGDTYHLYKNGQEVATGVLTGQPALTGRPLEIERVLFDSYILGKFDDVRVYNRALSAEEIKRLYNMGL